MLKPGACQKLESAQGPPVDGEGDGNGATEAEFVETEQPHPGTGTPTKRAADHATTARRPEASASRQAHKRSQSAMGGTTPAKASQVDAGVKCKRHKSCTHAEDCSPRTVRAKRPRDRDMFTDRDATAAPRKVANHRTETRQEGAESLGEFVPTAVVNDGLLPDPRLHGRGWHERWPPPVPSPSGSVQLPLPAFSSGRGPLPKG